MRLNKGSLYVSLVVKGGKRALLGHLKRPHPFLGQHLKGQLLAPTHLYFYPSQVSGTLDANYQNPRGSQFGSLNGSLGKVRQELPLLSISRHCCRLPR